MEALTLASEMSRAEEFLLYPRLAAPELEALC